MLTSRISYDRPTGTAGRRSTMIPCARAASVQASPSKAAPTAETPTHRAPRVFMAVPLLLSFAGFINFFAAEIPAFRPTTSGAREEPRPP